jgi:hypothetical protein
VWSSKLSEEADMEKRKMTFDGEGREIGYLTLSEARERYEDVVEDGGYITVGALRPDYVSRELLAYVSWLVDADRAGDWREALRVMYRDAREVAASIPSMTADAVAEWCARRLSRI